MIPLPRIDFPPKNDTIFLIPHMNGGFEMNCHYCGTEYAGEEVFCRFCGTRREPVPQVEPVAEPVTEAEPFSWDLEEEAAPICPSGPDLPKIQLPTTRGLAKMIFLGIITLGIYPSVIWCRIVTELNIAASRHDGRRTMPYFAMLLLTPITLGVFTFVWMHKFCGRIGRELQRRNIDYKFGAKTFWLWNILGSLILVGPFIFLHKLMKAMNRINRDFNLNG